MTDQTVTQQLQQLVNHQLVNPVGEQGYVFRHALLREAVYATLLRRERRDVHGAVAEVLEALYAGALDEHLADLAYHYFENEAWEQAQTYAQRAGELAQRRYAPHEAGLHFTQAIAAAERRGLMPPPELYRARGQVREVLGDFAGARADHETALAAARAAGQPRAEWQTLLDLGYLWAGRDYAETGRYFQAALDLARTLGDSALLGHSLNRLGNWHFNREEMPAALRCHTEALALFEQLGDREGLAETHDLLGLTTGYSGNIHAARQHYERALALFRELDDRRGQASSLAVMADLGPHFAGDMFEPGLTLREAHFLADQSLKLTRDIGWRAGEAYALLGLAGARLAAGDIGQAQRAARAGEAIATEINHRQWQTLAQLVYSFIALELGQYGRARTAALETRAGAAELNSVIWLRFSYAQLAAVALEAGDLDAAEAALAGQLDETQPLDTATQRLLCFAQGALAVARRDVETALRAVDRLCANLPNPTPGYVIPRLWKIQAEALALRSDYAGAESLLLAALPVAQPLRVHAWRLHASLGAVYAAQHKRREAGEQVGAAQRLLREMAATIPDRAERDHFLKTAERHLREPWPGGHVPT